MMARSSEDFSLGQMIPRTFGEWTLVPEVRLIEPEDPDSM
jgi:hypothetical protein